MIHWRVLLNNTNEQSLVKDIIPKQMCDSIQRICVIFFQYIQEQAEVVDA